MFSIDIAKLEQLAKIRLTPEEHAMLSAQLPSIFDYVARLQEVDTEGVDETVFLTSLVNNVRQDTVQEDSDMRNAALGLFPEKRAGALQVPSVGARTKKKNVDQE